MPGRGRCGDRKGETDYWTSFARDGVPTAENAAPWPVFTGPGGPTLRLHPDRVEPVDFAAEHHCAFWAGR